jgi:hypothetical protein
MTTPQDRCNRELFVTVLKAEKLFERGHLWKVKEVERILCYLAEVL